MIKKLIKPLSKEAIKKLQQRRTNLQKKIDHPSTPETEKNIARSQVEQINRDLIGHEGMTETSALSTNVNLHQLGGKKKNKITPLALGGLGGGSAILTGDSYSPAEGMKSGDVFDDDKHRKPDFTPKEKKDQQTKIDNAQETVNDPNKPIDDNAGLNSLFAAPSYGNMNIEKVQLAKYDDTENANQLKTELKNIGSKLESEINKLEDKQEAREQRIAIKSMFKTFIDAVATMYVAKHAPGAKYTAMTDPEEYHREISRLEANIQNARMNIVNKYKELKGEAKDEYRTKLSLGRDEVDAENRARMDYANKKFQFDKDKLDREYAAAMRSRSDKLKYLSDRESDAARMKEDTPLTTNQKLNIKNKITSRLDKFDKQLRSGEFKSREDMIRSAERLLLNKDEIDEVVKGWERGWLGGDKEFDSSKITLPSVETLERRAIDNLLGEESRIEEGVSKSGSLSKHEKAINWLNSPAAAEDPETAKKVREKLQSELGSK